MILSPRLPIVAVIVAVSLVLAGCSKMTTIPGGIGTFDKKAVHVCTVSGSTPLPLSGPERVVGAKDTTVAAVAKSVSSEFKASFEQLANGLSPKTYLALCFAQVKPNGVPAKGHLIIAQVDDAGGSAFVGTW